MNCVSNVVCDSAYVNVCKIRGDSCHGSRLWGRCVRSVAKGLDVTTAAALDVIHTMQRRRIRPLALAEPGKGGDGPPFALHRFPGRNNGQMEQFGHSPYDQE